MVHLYRRLSVPLLKSLPFLVTTPFWNLRQIVKKSRLIQFHDFDINIHNAEQKLQTKCILNFLFSKKKQTIILPKQL